MKYLVDENISKSDKFLVDHPEYVNVKYKIGQGVEDQEIMRITEKENCVLYTQDKRFALDALITGLKVWYHDQKNQNEYKLVAQKIDFD